jgi:hypothetical protein
MGGRGSGSHYHWWRSGKKDVVEHCRALDANRWMREGILRDGVWHTGGWQWTDATTGETTASLGYEVNTTDPVHPWLWLSYTITRTGERLRYGVRLQPLRSTVAAGAGGSRAPCPPWRRGPEGQAPAVGQPTEERHGSSLPFKIGLRSQRHVTAPRAQAGRGGDAGPVRLLLGGERHRPTLVVCCRVPRRAAAKLTSPAAAWRPRSRRCRPIRRRPGGDHPG